MRPWIAVLAVVLPSLIGCGVDRGPDHRVQTTAAPAEETVDVPAAETYALGTAMTPGGAVTQASTGDNFLRGGEVFLSVDVSGASAEQSTVEVRWLDAAGRVLHRDTRETRAGARYLPFSSGRTSQWVPGEHRAVIVIDGRRVSEKRFALL